MRELTTRQREVLELIQDFMNETHRPPTRAEIADALQFRSVNAAEEHLRALERKGAIELCWTTTMLYVEETPRRRPASPWWQPGRGAFSSGGVTP